MFVFIPGQVDYNAWSLQLQLPYVDVFSCLTHNLYFKYGARALEKQSNHLSGAAYTRAI